MAAKKKMQKDRESRNKMMLVIFDALNFRAKKMIFPYWSENGRKLVEVDFGKIAKTFKWNA